MKSPVLLCVYKLQDTVQRIFEVLRKVKAPQLYISANAPNPAKNEDEKCQAVLSIFDNIDWPCEVHMNVRKEHQPLAGLSLYYGISWFFEQEEEGIILEDDVLPNEDFFEYCDILLEKYRDNERIWSITGRNSFYNPVEYNHSYYFSRFTAIWGWASWRRTWEKYSFSVLDINEQELVEKFNEYEFSEDIQRFYLNMLESMKRGEIDTEDFQFQLGMWLDGSYCVTPIVNMNENIGMNRDDAVHAGQNFPEHKGHHILPLIFNEEIRDNKEFDILRCDFLGCKLSKGKLRWKKFKKYCINLPLNIYHIFK